MRLNVHVCAAPLLNVKGSGPVIELLSSTEPGRGAGMRIDDLKSSMKKAEKKMDQQFLDRKITNGIGPWGKFQRNF